MNLELTIKKFQTISPRSLSRVKFESYWEVPKSRNFNIEKNLELAHFNSEILPQITDI